MLNGEIAAHAYLSAASTQFWKKLSYRRGNLCGRIGQKNARGIAGRNARGRYDHSGSEWRARFPRRPEGPSALHRQEACRLGDVVKLSVNADAVPKQEAA